MHTADMNTTFTQSPISPPKTATTHSASLENCDAVMVSLRGGRFVIVRRDGPKRMFPVEPICKRIRDLQPGDAVFYKGQRETVHSLCVY
ncbi:MAG: hypothetical protein HKN47_12630 [Pirellulaceae bacterium]|nr:hypothetical protein [Pirellulaceae bacterium]